MNEKNCEISRKISISCDVPKTKIQPLKLPQYIAGLSATIGAFSAGLVLGWSSPAGDKGINLNANNVYPFVINETEFSWVVSIVNIGAAVICIPIGMLTDFIGRRRAMLVLTVPFTIGWICVIWPNSATTLIVGRFLLGLGGGAFCVTAPMYTAEIADCETRGRLGSYFELLLCTGIFASYTLGLLDNMFALSLISSSAPLIFFAIFFFMPETPMYYLKQGNTDQARRTLIWLRGKHYDIEHELKEQSEALAEIERNQVSFFMAMKSRTAVKALVIGYSLMFFQQFSGINAIIFYASTILQNATGDDNEWPIIVVGAIQAAAVFLSTLVVDKWGRRILLMVSGTVMCITALILGFYYYFVITGYAMDNFWWLPIACICGFVVFISFGFGPIPWMMMGELFSPQIKGIAGSTGCSFNWLMSFVVTKFYGDMVKAIETYGTFWVYSLICGLGVVFVFFAVPETRGKTLEEIQVELSGSRSDKYDSELNKSKTSKTNQ